MTPEEILQGLYDETLVGNEKPSRLSQHLAITSGPIPAGSPRDTASGVCGGGAIGKPPLAKAGA